MRDFVKIFSLLIGLIALPVPIFLMFGPPTGDSFLLNISWVQSFRDQLFAGELYPRWLYHLNLGAGSPVFYFYAPFPFWVGAIADALCLGCGLGLSYVLWVSVLLAGSGLAFFYWARSFASFAAAAGGAAVYSLLPYHFAFDFWLRSALGELAAYSWMPVILLGLTTPSDSRRYGLIAAAGYAGLIYSHLPSALLFSPVMVLFALVRLGLRQGAARLAMVVPAGIGPSALYLVPALSMQDTINAAAWWDQALLTPANWLWLDGRAPPDGAAPSLLSALLLPTVITACLGAGLWARQPTDWRVYAPWLVTMAYCWFLMTAPSRPVWEMAPLLHKVQFPWRVGIILDFAAATMTAAFLSGSGKGGRLAPVARLAAAAGLVVALASFYVSNSRSLYWNLLEVEQASAADFRVWVAEGFDAAEYRTAGYMAANADPQHTNLIEALAAMPEAMIAEGSGSITILDKTGGGLLLEIDAAEPVLAIVRQFHFPGWRLTNPETGEAFAVHISERLGLTETRLPPGRYRLRLDRGLLPEEIGGLLISSATLAGCLVFALWAPGAYRQKSARHTGPNQV